MSKKQPREQVVSPTGTSRSTRRYLLFGGCITILLVVALTYLLVLGQNISLRLAPLLNAALQARHEVTIAHLELEEVLVGDSDESMEEVVGHLARAQKELLSILDGSAGGGTWIDSIDNERIRPQVVDLLAAIPVIQDRAQQRFHDSDGFGFQPVADAEFDELFARFVDQIAVLQQSIQKQIISRQAVIEVLAVTAMFLVVGAVVFVGVLLLRGERQRERYVNAIEEANQKIVDKNDQLHALAHFDYLTRLPNRALFRDRLIQALAQTGRTHDQLVLLFIDLDHFKAVNDTKGHQAGDQLLVEVAARISDQVRNTDTVARLAGDEFAVILQGMESRIAAVSTARTVASKIVRALKMPFLLQQGTVNISASIGVSVAPEDGKDSETLIQNADRAMYHAKSLGRNNFQFYSEDLNIEATRHQQRQRWIREAASKGGLALEYQSQWRLQSEEMVGLEVTIACKSEQRREEDPERFMQLADEAGVIEKVSETAFSSLLYNLERWRTEDLFSGVASVHLSASLFRHPHIVSQTEELLARYGVAPDTIMLQIAESTLTMNLEYTRKVLSGLKAIGVRLSVNDVGKHYTTMRYLDDLPLDAIKLHRSLIESIGFDPIQEESLDHFINLARLMGLKILADGVETEEQEKYLRSRGDMTVQGIRFGRPVDAKRIAYMMSTRWQSEENIVPITTTK